MALFATVAIGLCFGDSGAYRIKLDAFLAPPTRVVGSIVQARINGGPPLRLLLDSGTQYIVLNRKAAMKSGCGGGSSINMIGVGARSTKEARHLRADTLELGDLTLHDVPVLVTDGPLGDGLQGALPLSIFAGFLIRLDFAGKKLDLLPYPSEPGDETGSLQSVSHNQLFFVKGTVNETREGYFLLDTGASYTALSHTLVRQMNIMDSLGPRVPLQGGTAAMDAPVLGGSIHLRVADRDIATGPVVAVDLSVTSRYHGLEVAGLLGYPSLCDSILVVSYRDRLIRIEPNRRRL